MTALPESGARQRAAFGLVKPGGARMKERLASLPVEVRTRGLSTAVAILLREGEVVNDRILTELVGWLRTRPVLEALKLPENGSGRELLGTLMQTTDPRLLEAAELEALLFLADAKLLARAWGGMSHAFQPAWRDPAVRDLVEGEAANPGLVFDRWLPVWRDDAGGRLVAEKEQGLGSLRAFARARSNGGAALQAALGEHHARLDRLLADEPTLPSWKGSLVLASPLCIGLGASHPTENGYTFDSTLGVPWDPGSALKGVARAWAEASGWAEERVLELFGAGGEDDDHAEAGRVVFLGAWPEPGQAMLGVDIVNAHLPAWYQYLWKAQRGAEGWKPDRRPLLVDDPVPSFLLCTRSGTRFVFRVFARARPGANADPRDAALVDAARRLLTEGLYWLGVGGRTSVGFGTFKPLTGTVAVPAGAGSHSLWMDVDGEVDERPIRSLYPKEPGGAPDTEARFSAGGPRTSFSGGVRVGADWKGIDDRIAAMVDEVGAREVPPALRVCGRMPLPAAFSLGFRLGGWRRLTLASPDGPSGVWTLDPAEGETPWLGAVTWTRERSGAAGTVVLHVSAEGRPLVEDAVSDLLGGRMPLSIGSAFGDGALGGMHGAALQKALRALFVEASKRFPQARHLVWAIDGPWPLAVLAGRATNPNAVRGAVDVPDYQSGVYVEAFHWERRA